MCLLKEVKEHDDINGTWRCTTTGENNLSKNCHLQQWSGPSSVDAATRVCRQSKGNPAIQATTSYHNVMSSLQLRKPPGKQKNCKTEVVQDTRSTTTGMEKTCPGDCKNCEILRRDTCPDGPSRNMTDDTSGVVDTRRPCTRNNAKRE